VSARPTVALTGASGFVGTRLADHLLAAGHRVRALSRTRGRCPSHPELEEIHGSLETPEALSELVAGSDCLIHLAAAIGGRNRQDFERVNAIGTRRLIEAAERENPGCRLIHVSSLAARAPELSHYAHSKRAAEQLVESSHLDWLILRPPAVYGATDPALAPLWQALAKGWLIQIGPRRARFSMLHVDDLCAAIVSLTSHRWPNQRKLCLDDGRSGGYGWADLSTLASRLRGRRIRTLRLPSFILAGAALGNLAVSRWKGHPPLLTPGKVRELTHPDWVCGDNAAGLLPDWRPKRPFEVALVELPGWSKRS
jgi:nucleoside-diphosphate-sugar epimerase